MTAAARHLAHFNWATLVGDLGSPEVAGFEDAIDRVNQVAERSPGFVWRDGAESSNASAIDWPMFVDCPRTIASFSVWEDPTTLKAFVYKTVHGAFVRRAKEWFQPESGPNYVLWWVPQGHIPDTAEARDRVELLLSDGPTEGAFDFRYLEAHP